MIAQLSVLTRNLGATVGSLVKSIKPIDGPVCKWGIVTAIQTGGVGSSWRADVFWNDGQISSWMVHKDYDGTVAFSSGSIYVLVP